MEMNVAKPRRERKDEDVKSAAPRKEVIGGQNSEGLPFSEAIRLGNLVFVSGMVGSDGSGRIVKGGIGPETHQTFLNIQRVLSEAGCSLADVVKVSVVLSDPNDFDGYNAAYREFFQKEPPARVTTAGQLTIDAKLEADVIAGVGASLKAVPTTNGRSSSGMEGARRGDAGSRREGSTRRLRSKRVQNGRKRG
jgi:reactive intermediate/imine deaminase